MRRPAFVLLLLALLVTAAPAHAQATLSEAARALDGDPVYVDPEAERALTGSEVERLRDAIREEEAGPLYLVVLPESVVDEAGGDPSGALGGIPRGLGGPGTYAGVVGHSF